MQWYIRSNLPTEEINYQGLGLTELEYRILLNRKISSYKEMKYFLNAGFDDLHSPFLMKDIIQSGNILSKHLSRQSKIRIVGDYDVDGIMSTSILMRGLQRLRAKVDYVIPHRVKDGYGLNSHIVEKAQEDGIDLIITCDNGIAAFDAVKKANDLNIDLIITDHHDLVKEGDKDKIPTANAVVNPKQEKDKYPFQGLCGGAVAFKLMHSMYTIHGLEAYVKEDFLAYVALATVCDVMPLINENRVLVKEGLEEINRTSHLGLKALIEACNLKGREIEPYHLGFILGPTINSVGRLEDANQAVELFLADDWDQAISLAQSFKELNSYRQELTNQGLAKIEEKLKSYPELPKVLMLVQEDLHESIAGIIAGRIKESTNRPTVVLTKTDQGLKGSGRSIEAYNMSKEFSKFRQDLLSFGGHAMACGLSLKNENFDGFYEKILNHCSLHQKDFTKKVYLDAQLPIQMVSMELIESLKKLEPFGVANPQPSFGDLNLKISNLKILGKNKNVIKFFVHKDNFYREAILFEDYKKFFNRLNESYPPQEVENLYYNRENNIFIDLVYKPSINEFNQQKTIQLVIESYRFKGV